MKNIITFYLIFFTIYSSAQVPQRMSYQAVLRNTSNTLLSQQDIGVRISILQADTAGQAVYIETHYTKTNINGLMTLQIGGGLKFFGDFNSIDWSTGHYFVKTETDPDGGFDYRITGYSELLSVPYALFSGGQSDSTNLIKKINTKLSITDTLSMLAPYAKKGNFITRADLDSTNNFDINLQGNISSSKNVTVKGNIEALGTTSTLGTIDKPFKGLFLSSGSLSIASDTLGQNVPAAVLSNVEGNLQISAGGLKLLNNAAFIAKNIQGELEGNASTANALKTPRKINGVIFDGTKDILIDYTNDNYVKNESLNGTEPFNMSIDGNFNSSKNVTVAGNIEALGTTSTLGTITKPFKGLYLSSGSLSIASDILNQNVPAAVLSNVTGNLQISAGGVKLMGDNTSFIAPRIVGELTGNASTATYAISAGSLSGTIPTWNQSTTGNAATATKLAATKNINGVAFDGSADIIIATTSPNSLTFNNSGSGAASGGIYDGSLARTISYNSIGASPLAGSASLTSVGTLTSGSIPYTLLSGTIPTWNQSTTGNAATATYATSAGTISGTIPYTSLTGTIPTWNQSTTGNAATATYATTAGSLSGTIPTWNQSTTGNAATATKLTATKNINGVAFDGSADISITAIADAGTLSGTTLNSSILNSSLTSVGTLTSGSIPYTLLSGTIPTWNQSTTGNAATATFATTAGTISGTIPYTSLSGTIPTWNQSTTGNAATATYATSAGSLSGTIPTWNQSTTGNAATATKLAATKNINGVAFDGSADISITAIADAGTLSGTTLNSTILNSSLTSVGTLTSLTVTNPISGSITGNAATATYATSAGSLSGTIPTWNQSTTGNASTATYATTAGTISGTIPYTSLSGTIPTWNQSTTGNAATATYATSAGSLSGTIPTWNQSTTGNAATATKLAATKNINGVAFDGSADISITAIADAGTLSGTSLNSTILNSSLTSVGTLSSGSIPYSLLSGTIPTWNQSTTGNAANATYATSAGSLSGTIPTWNQSTTGNAATATYATTAGTISGTIPYTSLSGTIPTWNQSTTGNAATATKLAATKNINGVAFDGSADISITAIADAGTLSGTTLNSTILNSSLTSVGTLSSGSIPYSLLSGTIPTWNQSTTGNAATATYATTAGTISGTIPYTSLSGTIPTWNQSTTGNATTATKLAATKNINGVAFDGSADITIATTAPNSLTYNNAGTGDVSGGTYDGSLAKTISYNSIGASPLEGSASIITVGTIATGTWNATTIGISKGGTNSTATPTAGAIVYGNGSSYAISAVGTSGQYLQSTGTGAPTWSQPGPASIQVLTTSGTYTTPAGVKAIIIELIGGGGGSGAIVAPSNNQSTVSGGGGSGAYTKAIILNPTSTYTFTIGAAGTASAAGTAGGTGGQTSFDGTNFTAPGGLGGGAGSATGTGTVSQGGAGGAAGVGGIFMITGNSGGSGFGTSAIAVSGAGGNSYIGAGGTSRATATASLAGANGIGYGGGASGAASSTTTLAAGAAGFHGVIVVTEYK